MGYSDGMGLYEGFGGNPGNWGDPWGLENGEENSKVWELLYKPSPGQEEARKRLLERAGVPPRVSPKDMNPKVWELYKPGEEARKRQIERLGLPPDIEYEPLGESRHFCEVSSQGCPCCEVSSQTCPQVKLEEITPIVIITTATRTRNPYFIVGGLLAATIWYLAVPKDIPDTYNPSIRLPRERDTTKRLRNCCRECCTKEADKKILEGRFSESVSISYIQACMGECMEDWRNACGFECRDKLNLPLDYKP